MRRRDAIAVSPRCFGGNGCVRIKAGSKVDVMIGSVQAIGVEGFECQGRIVQFTRLASTSITFTTRSKEGRTVQ